MEIVRVLRLIVETDIGTMDYVAKEDDACVFRRLVNKGVRSSLQAYFLDFNESYYKNKIDKLEKEIKRMKCGNTQI